MKCSELWLREWVKTTLTQEALCERLTMSGLEVDEVAPVAAEFSKVLVGEVTDIKPHPEADQLRICTVDVAQSKSLTIVCGAPNVKVGMKAPVAMIGASLPGDMKIAETAIRGVTSFGMLCSAAELGLSDDNDGLFVLPADAPVGKDLRDYLQLSDHMLDISITPNRGDCLSVKGLAREISALTETPVTPVKIQYIAATIKDVLPVTLKADDACPRYVGRVIRQVRTNAVTPVWLRERLRRSGIRSIHPVVDVTNYVMLELGQPMHAFDLEKLNAEVIVRYAQNGEKIALLDGSEKTLDKETLVIADKQHPLAIAGVMGGVDSSVTAETQNIFLESAYFTPRAVARQRQHYTLTSDSAYRFERGIDPTIQVEAIERATQLILEICGGDAGPVIEKTNAANLPKDAVIVLAKDNVTNLLGIAIPDKTIEAIFARLHFVIKSSDAKGWYIIVPAVRSDIKLPEDVIEEIARLYGYDNIPTKGMQVTLNARHIPYKAHAQQKWRHALVDAGYHEVVSYSFIDPALQQLLDPTESPRTLLNPITADMAVMRTNLWAGLLNTLLYNTSRKQHRVRLFEMGTVFLTRGKEILQQPKLAGLIAGDIAHSQWGMSSREVDFYDLKGDVERLLSLVCPLKDITVKPESHAALHPGRTAAIYKNEQKIGLIGELHPNVVQKIDLSKDAPKHLYVFELDLTVLDGQILPRAEEISKFPDIRRDIAILVDEAVPAKQIQDTIVTAAGAWLKDVFIFDVYQGKGITPGLKSIALGLLWQHPTRTLVDDEVTTLMEKVTASLHTQLGAQLRS